MNIYPSREEFQKLASTQHRDSGVDRDACRRGDAGCCVHEAGWR